MSTAHPVRMLNAEVARKIAAGEVIDRPNAIVRELMDNAIDSGADSVTVEINGGGIDKVRIVDNGCGMTKDDLQTCARPHSTSKIATETDLLNLTTLGFRGEALSSIAAVCRLSITSGGWKMRASVTEDHIIEQTAVLDGTIVQAEGLFENFPARRVFLKRPASEGILCKNTFVEKTLPCPEKSFRFVSDGTIKLDLPAGQTLTERFVKAMELKESPELFYEISARSDSSDVPDWSFKIVIGEPGVFRPNKKDIYIFVNGRRITEYSLVQAIEYGGQGYFPNGSFPVAAAFIQINPALVDFNIHPAKREVRFKDISALHHGISTTVKQFFSDYTNKTMKASLNQPSKEFGSQALFSRTNGSSSPADLAELALSDNEPDTPGKLHNPAAQSSFQKKTNISDTYSGTGAGNRSRFFEPRPFSEKYTIFHGQSSVIPETVAAADSYAKSAVFQAEAPQKKNVSARTQKVIEIADRAIAAYNKGIPHNETEDDAASQEKTAQTEKDASFTQKNIFSETKPSFPAQDDAASGNAANAAGNASKSAFNAETNGFHFLGSALGTFIIVEKGAALYIIDKHAAHERALFDSIMKNQSKRQHLLIPYVIETKDEKEDDYLESIQDELSKIGFECRNTGGGKWEFTTLQERWSGSELDLEHDLLDKKVAPKDLIYSIAAMTACKAAVKDGWILDDNAAEEIARNALELEDPHCPHGRPVYTVITREQLFSLVRRT
ncbi:DNA mismatch repair endonuclease MutL [Treponema sp.]|uniref:DNA mismatch repair endonuclease MutL n=1 Tax=Treponema sp. TaxID=166 RepID=UPI00257E5CD3|nr:DNA mismatch repair endonuclease MutL [Treponema sp.]